MIRLHTGLNEIGEGIHSGGALLGGIGAGSHAVAEHGIEPPVTRMEADAPVSADSCPPPSLCRNAYLYRIGLLGRNLYGTELAGVFLQ